MDPCRGPEDAFYGVERIFWYVTAIFWYATAIFQKITKNRPKLSIFGAIFFVHKNDLLMIADRLVAFLGCFDHF